MGRVRVRYNQDDVSAVKGMLDAYKLNSVCSAASCPNMGECFQRRTATFMILGDQCTRNCRFCNISDGQTQAVDEHEPERIAQVAALMGLKHVVITSVTRDDLEDGGAMQFAKTIKALRHYSDELTVEVLIPDFQGKRDALMTVLDAGPDVLNHNVETIRRLYSEVRPGANYDRSLRLLQIAKELRTDILTKTGIMVGLGESQDEVLALMEDAREVSCDIITIGQYMQPTDKHLPVHEYVSQEVFDRYKEAGEKMGFRFVASGTLVRSSYRAEEAIYHEHK